VPAISFEMTLEAELGDYNEDDTKARLALLYNVSVDAISLSVEAGSLKLSITILSVDRSEDGVAALSDAIKSKSVAEMSAMLGSNATVTTNVNTEELEEEYEATCPMGYWCSVGLDIPCVENTYNDELNKNNPGACKPCPIHSVSPEASVSIEACACKSGYYDEATDEREVQCVQCQTGSSCSDETEGVTLALLPLLRGYYRTGNTSHDLRRCPDFGDGSGCVGGVGFGEGPCKEWLHGAYCRRCNVSDTSRYYDAGSSACLPCEGAAEGPMLFGGGVALAALAAVLLWWRFQPHRNVAAPAWPHRTATLAKLARQLSRLSAAVWRQRSLRPKGKQLLGFYQIATRVTDVYEVRMPQAAAVLLQVFEVLTINVAGIGLPLQCLGLGTYVQQLAFTMLVPLVLGGATVLFCVGRHCCCSGSSKSTDGPTTQGPKGQKGTYDFKRSAKARIAAGLLSALPWLLTLSFLVLPMVSSAAFRAFPCEVFDNGRSYLRADYSVECSTATHTSEVHEAAKAVAWLGIGLYPIGISVLYAVLLLHARRAFMDDRATALTKALGFLVREYKPAYLWWELLEAWKKLALVGFATLVRPGSIYQLVAAFLLSLMCMLLTSVAMPFKNDSDDCFAKACGFALSAVFFFSVVLKVGAMACNPLTPDCNPVYPGCQKHMHMHMMCMCMLHVHVLEHE